MKPRHPPKDPQRPVDPWSKEEARRLAADLGLYGLDRARLIDNLTMEDYDESDD